MSKKVLVEVYFTYGKQDGRELSESYVEQDTEDLRKDLLEEWAHGIDSLVDSPEDFVSGESNDISIIRDGGDWDDPTGVEIAISSYELKKSEIESIYSASIAKLNKQFGVGE